MEKVIVNIGNKTYNCLWFLQFNKEKLVSLYNLVDETMLVVFSDVKQIFDSATNYVLEYKEKITEGKKNNSGVLFLDFC